MTFSVTIPLLNPNEPEAVLAALYLTNGQHILKGEPLCTLETTKTTFELTAEEEGYVVGLRHAQGETVAVGEILCYLATTPDWMPSEPVHQAVEAPDFPAGFRITQPALALARSRSLLLDRLPRGPLVTENMVRALLEQERSPASLPLQEKYDPSTILIYGGGGHGKMVIDIIRSTSTYTIAGLVDDGRSAG